MAGPFDRMFSTYESRYGLPNGFLSRMAQIESNNNPNARNPNSSAGGLFQFIDSTAKNYGLTDKFDPAASTDAASRLAVANRNFLTKMLGRDPTAGELYLAHQQGAGGASKLLSNPSSPASEVIGAKAANLNGGAGLTAGELASKWTNKFDGVGGAGGIAGTGIQGLLGNPTGASSAVANFGLTGPKGLDAPALPTAAVSTMQPEGITPAAAEAPKGLLDNKDVTGGLDTLAKAFGAGNKSQQQDSMVPVSNYSAEQAARIPAAQALMAQLLQKKMPRGMLG